MIWVDARNRKEFFDTLAVLRHKKELSPIMLKLKEYIEAEFGITVLNIIPEKYGIFNKPHKNSFKHNKKLSLNCCVNSYEAYKSMLQRVDMTDGYYKQIPNQAIQKSIIRKYFMLLSEFGIKNQYSENDIFIDFPFLFLLQYSEYVLEKLPKEITDTVLLRYSECASIWQIVSDSHPLVIFYTTDSAKLHNQENGISDEIKQMYLSEIKKLDEINMFDESHIVFDSKENLDKSYNGSLYYYFR